MMFSQELLENLPDDPVLATEALCIHFLGTLDAQNQFHDSRQNIESTNLEGFYTIQLLIEQSAEIEYLSRNFTNYQNNQDPSMYSVVQDTLVQAKKILRDRELYKTKGLFLKKYGMGFHYEFTDGDISKVQQLLNELRDLIQQNKSIADEHKIRLLKRLEQLQTELHKKMSDLDRFWGLAGDASVVLGKLGESAKPIVDIIKTITQIIWNTQARAEELPSDSKPPLLSTEDNSNSEL